MKAALISLLKKHWKVDQFRPYQEEICKAVINKNDTLALLPTGGGKSLCYQLPALIFKGPTLVISPLISLMQDQVAQANEKGIKSMAFNTSQTLDKQLDNACYGKYKLLFCSPEKIFNPLFIERINQLNIQCIAIDEAHCISEWGNDFRPAYKKIYRLRSLIPKASILALTASATPKVIEDIVNELHLIDPSIFKASFERSNISLKIKNQTDKYGDILRELKKNNQTAIVYCTTRRETEQLNQLLEEHEIGSQFFHGGLSLQEKSDRLLAWKKEEKKIMVATNAFGMGIDKGNVRSVFHLSLPSSLENYYQEIGRAGRDGHAAQAILYFQSNDLKQTKNQFLSSIPSKSFIQKCYKHLCNYLSIGYGDGFEQEFYISFANFCKTYRLDHKKVNQCLTLFDQADIFRRINTHKQNAYCKILCTPKQLTYLLENKNTSSSLILQLIARKYPGIFDQEISINLDQICQQSGLAFSKIIGILNAWDKEKILQFNYAGFDIKLVGLSPREDQYTLYELLKSTHIIRQNKEEKVDAMISFAKNNKDCKQQQLLAYFGENKKETCNNCNAKSCYSPTQPNNIESLAEEILKIIRIKAMAPQHLALSLPHSSKEEIGQALIWLEVHKKIKRNNRQQIICL